MSKITNRIEFWIIFFFLVRLIGITNPPLEIGHNWRQVTGLMVARNYLEVNANILYPRIDHNQGKSGIIGMEFPSLNYLHFLMAKIFGYTHWYGRLWNLIISSIGLLFFSKIISRFFNQRIAFASTLCLIGSIWFAFSRKIMPDTYCISLMFIGLYYGIRYIDKGSILNIFLFLIFSGLAILSKIPSGIYFVILFLMLYRKNHLNRRLILLISSVVPLALTYIWYFTWNPFLSKEYGNWYNFGTSFYNGLNEIISNSSLVLKNFYFNSFCSYIFFLLFIIGLVFIFRNKKKKLIITFLAVSVLFLIYIFKSGFYFYHHNYYIIPFIPVMALITGYLISIIKRDWILISILVLGISESIANQQHDFFIKNSEMYKLELECIADSISSKYDLIAINGNENPQQLYLTHRKGWNCNNSQISDSTYIENIASKGCKFLFVNKNSFSKPLNLSIVFNNDNYIVYRIDRKSNERRYSLESIIIPSKVIFVSFL